VPVQDAVSAFVEILAHGSRGEAYNVCSGTETPLREVLQYFLSLATAPVTVRFDPSRARPSEQRRVVGSCRKLEMTTGWKPISDRKVLLREVLDSWRESVKGAEKCDRRSQET